MIHSFELFETHLVVDEKEIQTQQFFELINDAQEELKSSPR